MFFGVSHVEVPVKRIDVALALYRDVLGFAEKHRGEGYVDLEAGAVLVRLVEAADRPTPARVRIQVARLTDSLEAVNAGGANTLYAPMRTPSRSSSPSHVIATGTCSSCTACSRRTSSI